MKRKILRKFGFKTDQSGIINRYIREDGAWDSHLSKTKNYILNAANKAAKELAVVLGSGWLLDVPAIEMSQQFRSLVLVDICHPRQIEHKLKNYKNIELLSVDITGLAEVVYELFRKKRKEKLALQDIQPSYNKDFTSYLREADFVASVNILNQLDILMCDYIGTRGIYTEHEINAFRAYIQSQHISLLPAGKSVIITDYEELNLDDNNKIINRKNLIHTDLLPNKNIEKWQWKFDQSKTYHSDCKTFFKVMASKY